MNLFFGGRGDAKKRVGDLPPLKNVGLIDILNISNKIFTSADIIDSNHWKNGVVITQGSLFEDDSGKLFIWVRTYFPIPSDKTNWLEIASRKT